MADQPYPGFEVTEELSLERKTWAAQRVAWVVFALLMVTVLLGLFGNGPLSWSEVRGPQGYALAYERFGRYGVATDVTVRATATSDSVDVYVSDEYLEDVDVRRITPQPSGVTALEQGVLYTFSVAPGASFSVVFRIVPESVGPLALRAGSPTSPIAVSQFIYP